MDFKSQLGPHDLFKFCQDNIHVIVAAVCVIVSVALMCICYVDRRQQAQRKENSVRLERLRRPAVRKDHWNISEQLKLAEIGENFNKWRFPEAFWGPHDNDIKATYGDIEVARESWNEATDVVDAVIKLLEIEMKRAANSFPGISILKFIKQGSAREGLKIVDADEFDLLLLFKIDGLKLQAHYIRTNGADFPEVCKLVSASGINNHDWPWKYDVLVKDRTGRIEVHSRNLQEKVFKSILQKASGAVTDKVTSNVDGRFKFVIDKFRINPPSINIEIRYTKKDADYDIRYHFNQLQSNVIRQESASFWLKETTLDIDIVPGLLLSEDTVPDPTDWNMTMKCPRYAVFKWYTENQPAANLFPYDNPGMLWRVCSSGYERHVFDVARGSREQKYIITALRIFKYELRRLKNIPNPEQLGTVVRSYFSKHVALYCFLYLCVMNKANLTGVREALAYLIAFLQVALEEHCLPHFFHGNANLIYMFPDCPFTEPTLRYNLFTGKRPDALNHALISLRRLRHSETMNSCLRGVTVYDDFEETFRSYIQNGKYYG